MSIKVNPYPPTNQLFTDQFVRRHTEPHLTPDYSDLSVEESEDLKCRFCAVARKVGISPGQLLTAAMITAVGMGEKNEC